MGQIVKSVWYSLPQHHFVQLGQFQIMPNHVHMIIIICRGTARCAPNGFQEGFARKTPTNPIASFGYMVPKSLSCIIRSFKSEITKQIRIMINNPQFLIWQRNYYEHIIRNEIELLKTQEYIQSNPQMWERDRNNIEDLYF